MSVMSVDVTCTQCSPLWLLPGAYSIQNEELLVVSARTSERHRHQEPNPLLTACLNLTNCQPKPYHLPAKPYQLQNLLG